MRRDRRRLRHWLGGGGALRGGRGLPTFVVVVPGTLGWLRPCLRLLPPELPLRLIVNGLGGDELRELRAIAPDTPIFRLSVVRGAIARHGAVLDLLLRELPLDFAILDHDCYVFDPTLFDAVTWEADEVVAGIRRQGFVMVNPASGRTFPRTHFLVLRGERLRAIADRHGIGCGKATRTPPAVAPLLAGIGIGDHNFPPPHLPFYDTLQLLLAVAFAEGGEVRWLPVAADGIRHIGGTARAAEPEGDRGRRL